MKYKRSRRNIHPAVYNAKRLREKPAPVAQLEGVTQKKPTKSVTKKPIQKIQPTKAKSPKISIVDTLAKSPTAVDENVGDANLPNNSADDVICLSDFAHLKQHRPMHFDMISGELSCKQTVITIANSSYTINMQLSIMIFYRINLIVFTL